MSEVLANCLKSLSTRAGIYLMLDRADRVLYVGKAKNLKNRVSSYFRTSTLNAKTAALVKQIHSIQTLATQTENEALILENNLIKKHRPPYNILFRDDKSYPYIFISADPYPLITLHRGNKKNKGSYFGPYPQGREARETVHLLRKLFLLRSCENTEFSHRSRPCLQYQIKRCSAPCVNFISPEHYQAQVRYATLFLEGKSSAIMDDLAIKMNEASSQLQFEEAAFYRDQIRMLKNIQSAQSVQKNQENVDVIIARQMEQSAFVYLLMIRDGKLLGHKHFIQQNKLSLDITEVISTFILQYYLESREQKPNEIILETELPQTVLLESILAEQFHHPIHLKTQVKIHRQQWLELAKMNAQEIIQNQLSLRHRYFQQFCALQKLLQLPALPERIECFDISHTQGTAPIAACVVFGVSGALKKDYRRFNVTGIKKGDDFAAIHQAVKKRYTSLLKRSTALPNLLIIDGGKGQLTAAQTALDELGLTQITLLGIAKGSERKRGAEKIYIGQQRLEIEDASRQPAFQLLQKIRDEAHRFAITGHRLKRQQQSRTSILDEIPQLGDKRRSLLLTHFGGLQGLLSAGAIDIATIKGISKKMAETIFQHLHTHS